MRVNNDPFNATFTGEVLDKKHFQFIKTQSIVIVAQMDVAAFLTEIICGERFFPAQTIRDLENKGREQRNQILAWDVSTSSNLASACAAL